MKNRLTAFIIILLMMPQVSSANPENNKTKQPVPASQKQKPAVFEKIVKGEMSSVYKRVFTALENNGYFVIFEPNIGKNLSHFAKRWGDDYNKNKLDSIRSMVFCNGWYANQVSNHDPRMLALCPLHITLYSKDAKTHVLFVLPSKVAVGSGAEKIAQEIENDVIRTINNAL